MLAISSKVVLTTAMNSGDAPHLWLHGHRKKKRPGQTDDCRVTCHQTVHMWTQVKDTFTSKMARSPGWCDDVPLLQCQIANDRGVIAASSAGVSATSVSPVRSGVQDVVYVWIPWIASCRVSPDESVVLQITLETTSVSSV